jgi:hypothetical protein
MADMAAAWTACTKQLFAEKKGGPRSQATCSGVCLFAGIFEGGFGKSGVLGWFFCGEVVVNCVVNRGGLMVVFEWLKTCHST